MKEKLLFYNAYQEFYKMADKSEVFKKYCKKAFGEDFSQDGFSDVAQLNKILSMVDLDSNACVLDIGCGNGKMLEYIHNKTGAGIYGFDYSENAIEAAVQRIGNYGNFQVALIGDANYPDNKFDLITSMDTIYFAPDMSAFVSQIYSWLKPDGCFICGYQEGDVMRRTKNCDTTALAKALKKNGFKYSVFDYTKETYEMLKHKREVIISMQEDFKTAGITMWYEVVKRQTDSIQVPFEVYRRKNARYIYILKKCI
jgi:2-polyprenyl-3-methyl-5-hydroxy-6-metoxy-1,4-benzoquinol methylase